MPSNRWIRRAWKASNSSPARRHSDYTTSGIELSSNMPPIKEVPEEDMENAPGDQMLTEETPVEHQETNASAPTESASVAAEHDPDAYVLTSKGALDLIYRDIRIAAIEEEEYDPYKLVAEAKAMALEKQKNDPYFPGAASAATYFGASEPATANPESTRPKPTTICDRVSTLMTDVFSKKSITAPESRPATSARPKQKGPETQGTQSTSKGPVASDTELSLPLRSKQVPESATSSYASASAAASFYPESSRDALLRGRSTNVESSSTAGTSRPSEHAEPNPLSGDDIMPQASAAASGPEFPPPFTKVAVAGGPSKLRARGILQAVIKFIYESDNNTAEPSTRMKRLVDFAGQHGWMLLCICAHSKNFYSLIDADEKSWAAVHKRIAKNVISMELYAVHCKLDWQMLLMLLPPKARAEHITPKVHYENIKSRQVISLAKTLYSPEYRGEKQVEITENFYRDVIWHRRKPRTTREAGECICALCGSREICSCEIPNDPRAPIELREYSNGQGGIGVRSLREVKKGEYMGVYLGELYSPPLRDTAWVVEQMCPGDNSIATISMIDAAVHGTWARYLRHSCRPSAEMVSTAVGETLCVLVRAVDTIAMFDEITVDFGPEYFSGPARSCSCGLKECRYGGRGEEEEKGKGKEKAEQPKAPAGGRGGGRKGASRPRKARR